jgi:hypothetical protein
VTAPRNRRERRGAERIARTHRRQVRPGPGEKITVQPALAEHATGRDVADAREATRTALIAQAGLALRSHVEWIELDHQQTLRQVAIWRTGFPDEPAWIEMAERVVEWPESILVIAQAVVVA